MYALDIVERRDRARDDFKPHSTVQAAQQLANDHAGSDKAYKRNPDGAGR